jgi:hypothetical protein
MELRTEFSKVGRRYELHVPGNRMLVDDDAVEHDAAAAHAMKMAAKGVQDDYADRQEIVDACIVIQLRAADLMREWGFTEQAGGES